MVERRSVRGKRLSATRRGRTKSVEKEELSKFKQEWRIR